MITRTLTAATAPLDEGYLSFTFEGQTQQRPIGEFLTLGREPGAHVVLDDQFTSERHARIERKTGGFLLRDLRSRNGTFVNGARVFEIMLNDGDHVRVGRTDLYFTNGQLPRGLGAAWTSKSPRWNAQLSRLPNVAAAPFPVLLTGPSGSGKDVLARAIHALSNRRSQPLVSVNCGALSESLVESELFGHVRGAFTGATIDRKGAFQAARGGTLFLDEIGDLPAALQPKLLRALENGVVRPVGSDKDVATDVRVIAATHHDLRQLVDDGRFREDLYFRLHVVHVETPALRERMEDFDDLFYEFARALRVRFSFNAIQRLKEHAWPGNIRELRNVVARAKAFCGDQEVGVEDVDRLVEVIPPARLEATRLAAARPQSRSVLKQIESEMIRARLIANRGNQRRTAADLGMPKSTLHDRLRAYAIDLDELLGRNGPTA